MFLPFLKEKKWPRLAKPMDQKSYGLSASETLEDYCIEELMTACMDKNVSAFLAAIEALLLNCFEDEQPNE